MVGGVNYTLVRVQATGKYGCEESCVYKKQEGKKLYCFGKGNLEVESCQQMPADCPQQTPCTCPELTPLTCPKQTPCICSNAFNSTSLVSSSKSMTTSQEATGQFMQSTLQPKPESILKGKIWFLAVS